ncbi:putative ferric aerobactin receptor [hydrothermal vent metagenome]|uniref:Putative ferric aerobactin receptor n=1 Tax=hydrothermal vent metagenome TaxID=652676 RepID=A0A3B0UTI4_9ZZZZ
MLVRKSVFIFSFLWFLTQQSIAQFTLNGVVADSTGVGIEGVAVKVANSTLGSSTNKKGEFSLHFKNQGLKEIDFSHIEFNPITKKIQIITSETRIEVRLKQSIVVLKAVDVETKREVDAASSVTIKAMAIKNISTPFNDISNILASLPSVMSNSELSTAYSVRGGNYDENIVRVNGIQVYRPFLVRAGQQEGLSFINSDLIQSVNFSAGGWDATNGGKMSSLLQATYKKADGWHGGFRVSLIGASGYLEGNIKNASFLIGIRHKRSRYMLNSLDVNAEYDPRFTDIQNYWNINVSDKVSIETLFSYAANKYQVTPENGQISFGTFNQELRFEVGFDGQEQMFYNTLQGAVKVNYKVTQSLDVNVIASYMQTYEIENGEVEGGYRLCDVDKNLDSDNFNECIQIRGIGTLYRYARNNLDANIIDFELNGRYRLNEKNNASFGVRYSTRNIQAGLNEYSFTDSIGYTTITGVQSSDVDIFANELTIYGQHRYQGVAFGVTTGIYASQNSLNGKFYISPRLLLNYSPIGNNRATFKLGAGIYRQQPFYREILDINGQPTANPTTQSSMHLVIGNEYRLTWWGRDFNMSTEAYYKSLWDLVPYQFDNVRVEYYPDYSAKGYAVGFEARLAGEFIEGTESWFSLGLLSTKEQIEGIDAEMVRRPTDQRFKIGAVFEDHIPNDPTLRVNLSFQYGSGLPIGPPNDLTQRNLFTADAYTRVDITFSKVFLIKASYWDNIRVGLGIYNLLGNKNAVTYTWIQDFSGQNFAVPNNLTGRLFNITLSTDF